MSLSWDKMSKANNHTSLSLHFCRDLYIKCGEGKADFTNFVKSSPIFQLLPWTKFHNLFELFIINIWYRKLLLLSHVLLPDESLKNSFPYIFCNESTKVESRATIGPIAQIKSLFLNERLLVIFCGLSTRLRDSSSALFPGIGIDSDNCKIDISWY